MTSEERLKALNAAFNRYRQAPFFKDRLPEKPLASLEELKSIPFMTKADLIRHSPFGMLCVPQAEVLQYHESFGTTGTPASTWFHRGDLRDNADQVNACGIGFRPDDTVLIRFPYAISMIAHAVHRAAQERGAAVIAASSRSAVSPFPRVIELMGKLQVTVLAGLPLQALLLAETAELLGFRPDRDFPHLRALLLGGEPIPPGKRRLLEDIWGVPVFTLYGMTEIGTAGAACRCGTLHPLEDYFIFEVWQEDLTREAPPGETGILVVTTITDKATPVVRYVTEDRVRLIPAHCPCGHDATLEVRGRKGHTVTIGDRVLDLWDLDGLVDRLPCRRFWVVGVEPPGLRFVVETEPPVDSLPTHLIDALAREYPFPVTVDLVPKGTLYDRQELLRVGIVGKPRYIYSSDEMSAGTYLRSSKV
ncbi:coenzyme f390 synthetase, putative [Heliomicrobium modesticaldum Ice1]|uniref:Coenzyme f390 synthetase, putative n=1 Tax=Heliobacterium modesticaldum (strain ATCC 51547 / Ice1) TaxID=498761 RepID=B0TEU5_HELMI|nr:AMP-binding protein [Heliomicrobium modesticaldum]ABZ84347.1 coenzyme f390 synthetase, putative [Heliomicrobium modesticaldum Ice1]